MNHTQKKGLSVGTASLVAAVVGITLNLPAVVSSEATERTAIVSPDGKKQLPNGELAKGRPNYKTLLPEGKSISALGGWTRVSPPRSDPVYAFADQVAGTPIIVSQQPLPKEFAGDTKDQVRILAEQYLATKRIDAEGTEVYVGTSGRGPQSAITTKDELLILMKTQAKLTDAQWKQYVSSLR